MNPFDLIRSAVSNSLRSKTRTTLTVLAIFIGAFTLTLTSGVGTGINRYIDTTLSSIGASDVITVSKAPEVQVTEGPVEYDPDAKLVSLEADGGPPSEVAAILPADLAELRTLDGVLSVEPTLRVAVDYVQYGDGRQYQAGVGGFIPGMTIELAEGDQPAWDATGYEAAIPVSFVEPLGFSTNADAVGEIITLGVTDAEGTSSTVDATVTGVAEPGIVGGDSLTPNDALVRALYDRQSVGLTDDAKATYSQAIVRFEETGEAGQVDALKADLVALGYTGTTVTDQIGAFKTIIDGIVLVLNGFAVIALLAASFGIVNTLLMSVQERTREIGLMKAMGMSGGKIFGLFSFEAVFIGVLGSVIGVGIGVIAGTATSGLLSGGLLADLPGLTLVAFDPIAIGVIVLAVMAIAFLAGTIPALRAARQDPIESLRYE